MLMLNRFFLASIGTMALTATVLAQPAKPAPAPAPTPKAAAPATTPAKPATPAATPAAPAATDGMALFAPKDIKWGDIPPSLPQVKGGKFAVLEGDPKAAGPLTFRLKVPAGYKIQAHTHPATEHVTVISGEAMMGMG